MLKQRKMKNIQEYSSPTRHEQSNFEAAHDNLGGRLFELAHANLMRTVHSVCGSDPVVRVWAEKYT